MKFSKTFLTLFGWVILSSLALAIEAPEPIRVFIFAGQSNMVGSDSKVADIERFPPFQGLEQEQKEVRFWYCIGRENKMRSEGWVDLQPVNNVVGPELSFARTVTQATDAPIAIIKCAAGGTHLGGDWNPDNPSGFEMYPLLLEEVRKAVSLLDQEDLPWRLEGFVWHQGENDMFNEDYMNNYGDHLTRFMECVRRDLKAPELPFYIGELCTKTIWGMDLRPRMYAISVGQKEAVARDPLATYIPTSHIGVEIGGGVGLHYHYGTLGQLEHGVNYAQAYLKTLGRYSTPERPLTPWPYPQNSAVRLIVLAGHRNMEGERAFIQQAKKLPTGEAILKDRADVAYRYSLGGGVRQSKKWEPLGTVSYYDTFGPELSLARTLSQGDYPSFAIAKFTHSGSQIIDWTPEGSVAPSRNLYPAWIEFIQAAIADLEQQGHRVEVSAIVYHMGENDMSFGPFRKAASDHLVHLVQSTRRDIGLPQLPWIVSQQPPTKDESVNQIDVLSAVKEVAGRDPYLTHLTGLDLPPQEKQLVIDTPGIIRLGEVLGDALLEINKKTVGESP